MCAPVMDLLCIGLKFRDGQNNDCCVGGNAPCAAICCKAANTRLPPVRGKAPQRPRKEITMYRRHDLMVFIFTACMVTGCGLKDPVDIGVRCDGIDIDHVVHLESDGCMKNGTCREQDADAVSHGFCPPDFICTSDTAGNMCRWHWPQRVMSRIASSR